MDVRDDGEIANLVDGAGRHGWQITLRPRGGKDAEKRVWKPTARANAGYRVRQTKAALTA
jgi:hypothetical protein